MLMINVETVLSIYLESVLISARSDRIMCAIMTFIDARKQPISIKSLKTMFTGLELVEYAWNLEI